MTKKIILILFFTVSIMIFASCENKNSSSEQSIESDTESSVTVSTEAETTTTSIVTTTTSATTTSSSKPVTSNTVKTTAPQTKPGEFMIGTGPTLPPPAIYSCGFPNHVCTSEIEHNLIVECEGEGCPYCGSHSCPSFYCKDQWGHACCDPTKCPMYDVRKDPAKYCQTCGKPYGDGYNGTCCKFIVDMVCPYCGQLVKANTCHFHN